MFEKFGLQGKVAFVTGAGRNLGKVIALALSKAGADVVVTSRTLSEVQKVAEEIRGSGQRALAFTTDITHFSEVEEVVRKVISEFERIDILVNNAAAQSTKPLLETSEEDWRSVIDTNLTGAFFCCKAVGPFMVRQRNGRIINISSRLGIRGMTNEVAYCASKGGLLQLTRALALEWAPYNILVNAIAPGILNTPLSYEIIQKGLTAAVPLKRAGEPEEIATLVVYLASEASTYLTGEVIVVDGGRAAM